MILLSPFGSRIQGGGGKGGRGNQRGAEVLRTTDDPRNPRRCRCLDTHTHTHTHAHTHTHTHTHTNSISLTHAHTHTCLPARRLTQQPICGYNASRPDNTHCFRCVCVNECVYMYVYIYMYACVWVCWYVICVSMSHCICFHFPIRVQACIPQPIQYLGLLPHRHTRRPKRQVSDQGGCVCVCMCACKCVCMRDGERDNSRERDR